MHEISFMSANFVAREVGYHMTQGWGQGDAATQAHFAPLTTFAERFGAMLAEVAALGFDAIDLWTGHLHWQWATPEHLAAAKQLLAQHKLRPVSYAGGFGSNLAELRAACRLCAELGIPVLGGGTPLLAHDRAGLVRTLREFGLIFGLENHPEKTAAEVLAKLGEGDEDVVGVAVDTGWFGTQGMDAAAAVRALVPRLKHFHAKDVKARRAEKTGFAMIDGGHETCALGEGIVPVEAAVKVAAGLGYRGAFAVEHEPEDFDPREDCRRSRERLQGWLRAGLLAAAPARPLRVAVVGCGNIAGPYARNLAPYPEVQIVGAQDVDRARAESFVADHAPGARVYSDLGDVLADPTVEAVVNLTIHHAHVEVITRCLEAGKHVHSEKPIAPTHAEARRLVALAEAKNRRLSAAPTTWLGEAQQTAWKLLRDGRLGTPRVAYAEVNWGRIESWHPNPGPFYAVGPVFDVAVYPLTLLTAWFGPAVRVTAAGGVVFPQRRTKEGTPFTIETPEWSVAIVEHVNGVRSRVTANFYVGWNTRQQGLEVHGDEGMLALDRWDVFDAAVWHGPLGAGRTRIPLLRPAPSGIEFGRGVVELAHAIAENRPHRPQGAHAAHVVEIMETIHACMADGQARPVTSTFTAPTPMPWAH
jgi:predicted dehydrogenase/sugar phosphate isomerase/epimerase